MVTRGVKDLIAEANAKVECIAAGDAIALIDDTSVVIVDVRETQERRSGGVIEGSIHAPRGYLEMHADPASPLHNAALAGGKRLVLYCATGGRSALAAKTLADMGIERVGYIAGGLAAWSDAGGRTQD